eukprot:TRINITY_DN5465_c0_g5_i2.p1 TRINITY_DN5465_c0_g5~~TRINITY_DN5465_c0_g5_i2.p1  ORF type:complete len:332 (-),score=46.63 TRINITY_DN5465_c0_g5_i2:163-1128(-)
MFNFVRFLFGVLVFILSVGFIYGLVEFLPSDDSLIIDEYKQAQYVIAVDKSGKQFKSTVPAGKRESRAYGLQGYQYQCLLINDVVGTNGTEKDSSDDQNTPDPYEIINSQLDKLCLYRREQWWIYQYCHKKMVRQYHEEHEVLMSEYFLGYYNHSQVLNWTEVLQNQNTSFQGSNTVGGGGGDSTRYASLLYDEGELCDLTEQPRQTEVRFVCRPDLPDKNTIIQIKEPATCQYTMIIAIPALCSHPDFEVQSPDVHHILCSVVPGTGESEDTTLKNSLKEDKQQDQQQQDDGDDDDEYLDYDEDEEPTIQKENQHIHDEL